MNRLPVVVLALAAATSWLPRAVAQEQASTLHRLTATAAAICVATAMPATDAPDVHAVGFAVREVLRGDLAPRLQLAEPAGACCGRALAAVVPGSSYVLFLQRRDDGWQPLAADRGIVAAEAPVLQHVRTLLANADAATVLVAALASPCERVRDDAALALPTLPRLRVDPALAAQVVTAMQPQLEAGTTRGPSLLAALVRIDPRGAAATLLPLYLGAATAASRPALAAELLRLPAADVVDAIAAQDPETEADRVLALELLRRRPDPANLRLLDRWLAAAKTPRVALAATEALLANGCDAAALGQRVHPSVLRLAERRSAADPTFRVVRPRTMP